MARHRKDTVTSPVSPGDLSAQNSGPADTRATHASADTTPSTDNVTTSPSGSVSAGPDQRQTSTASKILGISGELILTLGIVIMLFVVYEAYWTNIQSDHEQSQAKSQLDDKWADARNTMNADEGEAMGKLRIPTFGSDWNYAIIQGTSASDLSRGPGHYTRTQNPGDKGNFALAGHRVGRGAPFNDLGYLKTCDSIVVETRESWYVYRVLPIDEKGADREQALAHCTSPTLAKQATSGDYASVRGRYITTPSNISTIASVPGHEDSTPESSELSIITLTTCHPQFSNAERMVIHAVLDRVEAKDGNKTPVELKN
ncbi:MULTISPECIES: class E sortase [Corynebacterium]|uniref:class E sortase n=1 Tax=Corynebacterium TaxID=1716 RepID=UPI00195A97AE|nr:MULTISPECIES: class E sortase [Corynebacterium]MDN8624265.1 class E sortase [Corynebacterium kroppenstedtii]QRQ65435.1 class E sortase [Corynebacterium kroppenstedtii]